MGKHGSHIRPLAACGLLLGMSCLAPAFGQADQRTPGPTGHIEDPVVIEGYLSVLEMHATGGGSPAGEWSGRLRKMRFAASEAKYCADYTDSALRAGESSSVTAPIRTWWDGGVVRVDLCVDAASPLEVAQGASLAYEREGPDAELTEMIEAALGRPVISGGAAFVPPAPADGPTELVLGVPCRVTESVEGASRVRRCLAPEFDSLALRTESRESVDMGGGGVGDRVVVTEVRSVWHVDGWGWVPTMVTRRRYAPTLLGPGEASYALADYSCYLLSVLCIRALSEQGFEPRLPALTLLRRLDGTEELLGAALLETEQAIGRHGIRALGLPDGASAAMIASALADGAGE